ncbi:hypothetical protein DFA_01182 [Cavenderia fasciculata]|uniref:Uncharacterized protein n=1 Tax=Cavenderia fasciculata TaxID=261658 RepID=F4PRA1_CACFS|nr:uncharacterized protein DFA_01182 [Cavenderia fasciculata]EGG21301.1 hypothetical protein DFA_01182 [Cavenderia fasciculata]|eukprot:XP_004359151.1 hypothetical protein DFA_01182 [Cavenderia fasciculata]
MLQRTYIAMMESNNNIKLPWILIKDIVNIIWTQYSFCKCKEEDDEKEESTTTTITFNQCWIHHHHSSSNNLNIQKDRLQLYLICKDLYKFVSEHLPINVLVEHKNKHEWTMIKRLFRVVLKAENVLFSEQLEQQPSTLKQHNIGRFALSKSTRQVILQPQSTFLTLRNPFFKYIKALHPFEMSNLSSTMTALVKLKILGFQLENVQMETIARMKQLESIDIQLCTTKEDAMLHFIHTLNQTHHNHYQHPSSIRKLLVPSKFSSQLLLALNDNIKSSLCSSSIYLDGTDTSQQQHQKQQQQQQKFPKLYSLTIHGFKVVQPPQSSPLSRVTNSSIQDTSNLNVLNATAFDKMYTPFMSTLAQMGVKRFVILERVSDHNTPPLHQAWKKTFYNSIGYAYGGYKFKLDRIILVNFILMINTTNNTAPTNNKEE